MDLPLTYGQCLRKIMQNNRLSVNTLSRKMGYHSPTQLTRILNDEVSSTLITKFHHQFMLIFDWLISPAEIKALSTSLQFSCLGEEQFLTRRAMFSMLFEPPPSAADSLRLCLHPGCRRCSVEDLLQAAEQLAEIELLVLGSAFDVMLPLLSDHVTLNAPNRTLHIRHAFIMAEKPAQVVSRISMLVPYLNTNAYQGVYCTQSSEETCRFLQQNQIAVARFRASGKAWQTAICTPPQKDGINLCLLHGDAMYTFYERQLNTYKDQLRPIKSVYPQPKTVSSLLTLCERDLFLEQKRACFFVRLDLCFPLLPTSIVLRAVDDGARIGMTMNDPLMQELCRVHEARHQNLMNKKETSMLIFSCAALLSFAHTGHMSDHLYAMRDFTPQERREVLVSLLHAVQRNPALHLHFFRNDASTPVSAFAAYEDMGMQISANNTAYDLSNDHSEVFVGLPAFAETFSAYCANTLIPEHCLDKAESIAYLETLIARIDGMIDQTAEP